MNEELLRKIYDKAGANPEKFDIFLKASQDNPDLIRKIYDKAGANPDKFDIFLKNVRGSSAQEQQQPEPVEQPQPEQTTQQEEKQPVSPPELSPAAQQWEPGDKPIVFGQDTQKAPELPGQELMRPGEAIPATEERLKPEQTRVQELEQQTGMPVPSSVAEASAPLEKFRLDEDLYKADQVLTELEETGRLDDVSFENGDPSIKATGLEYQRRKREALGQQEYLAQKNKRPTLIERELSGREEGQFTLREYRQDYEDLSTDSQELSDAFSSLNTIVQKQTGEENALSEYIALDSFRQELEAQIGSDTPTPEQTKTLEEIEQRMTTLAGGEDTQPLFEKGLKIHALRLANQAEFLELSEIDDYAYARRAEELIETKQAMADARNRDYKSRDRWGKAALTARRLFDPAFFGESNLSSSVMKAGLRIVGNLGTLVKDGGSGYVGPLGGLTSAEGLESAVGAVSPKTAERSSKARQVVSDVMMSLKDDFEDMYPMSTNRKRSPNTRVLRLKVPRAEEDIAEQFSWLPAQFQDEIEIDVDRDGNIMGAYDNDGYLIKDFEPSAALIKQVRENQDKAKSQWNTDGLYQTIADTGIDVGAQILLMKGAGAGASMSAAGNALINTGVTAGMMMQSQYEAGLEVFDGDEEKAMEYAKTTGLLIGAASNLFGMEARLVGGAPLFSRATLTSPLTKRQIANIAKRSGGDPFLTGARTAIEGTLGEVTEETLFEPAVNIGTALFMGGEAEIPDLEEMKSTAAVSLAVGFLGEASSVRSSTRNKRSKLYSAAVNGARADLPNFKIQLRQAIDDGLIEVPTRSVKASEAEKDAFVEEQANRIEYIDESIRQLDPPKDSSPELIPLLDLKYDRQRALKGRNVGKQYVGPTEAQQVQIEKEIQEIDDRINEIAGIPPVPKEETKEEAPAPPQEEPAQEPEQEEQGEQEEGAVEVPQDAVEPPVEDIPTEKVPIPQEPPTTPENEAEDLLTEMVGERLSPQVVSTVQENLQEIVPGMEVVTLSNEAYQEQTGTDDPAFVDYDQNKIYLNEDTATARNAYEEAAHVALTKGATKRQQVQLARTIESELMSGNEGQRKLGVTLMEETNRYESDVESGIDTRSDEFLAKLAGRLAEAGENLTPRRSQRITAKIRNFFGNLLGRKPTFTNFADASQFMNTIATGVREGGLTSALDESGSGKSFSRRQDTQLVMSNAYRANPNLNPTELAAAMAGRGFPITTREAFDQKMKMIESGAIEVPQEVVKRDQDAILGDDPAYSAIQESVQRDTRNILQEGRTLSNLLTSVEDRIKDDNLRKLVPQLATAVKSGDPLRVADVAREMSPLLRATAFGTKKSDIPNKEAVKAALVKAGKKDQIRGGLNGMAENAMQDNNIRQAREIEQEVRSRGKAPVDQSPQGNEYESSGTFGHMTNYQMNQLREELGYDKMEEAERKSMDQVLNEGRELLDKDGSGYRFQQESGILGVSGPDAIVQKSLSGLPLTEAELAAIGMSLKFISIKRDEKTRALRELQARPNRLSTREERRLAEAIQRDNADIDRHTNAIRRAKTTGARVLATTRWLNLAESMYTADWMRQELYEAVGRGKEPTPEQKAQIEELIRAKEAAERAKEVLEKEEDQVAQKVYEIKAKNYFEDLKMLPNPSQDTQGPVWRRWFRKERPTTLEEAITQYKETLNNPESKFFDRNVALLEAIKHMVPDVNSVPELVDKLVEDYPDLAPNWETMQGRVNDALLNLNEREVARKKVELNGRLQTIQEAKAGANDLRNLFQALNRPYRSQKELNETIAQVTPGLEDAIKRVHSLMTFRVNVDPKDLANAFNTLSEVSETINTLSRGPEGSFSQAKVEDQLKMVDQSISTLERYLQIDGDKADARIGDIRQRLTALSLDNPDLTAMYDAKSLDRVDPLLSAGDLAEIRAARTAITGELGSALRRVNKLLSEQKTRQEDPKLTDSQKIEKARQDRIEAERKRINSIVSELNAIVDLRKSVNVGELLRLGGELRDLLRQYPEIVGSKAMADKLLKEGDLLESVLQLIESNKMITKEQTVEAARKKLKKEYEEKQAEIMNDTQRLAAIELDQSSARFVRVTQRILDKEKIIAREKAKFDQLMRKFRRQAEVDRGKSRFGKGVIRGQFALGDFWEMGRSLVYMADASYIGNQLFPYIMKYGGDFNIRRGINIAREMDGTWAQGAWEAFRGSMPRMGAVKDILVKGTLEVGRQHLRNWRTGTKEDRRQVADKYMQEILDDPFYILFRDVGLHLSKPGTIEFADEMWQSDFDQYTIPKALFSRTRDLSEDMMTVSINMARMNMMKDYYLSHPRATKRDLQLYASVVNMFTGTASSKVPGSMLGKQVSDLAPMVLSAPRLLMSKIALGIATIPFHMLGYKGYTMGSEAFGALGGFGGGLLGIQAAQVGSQLVNKYVKDSPAVKQAIRDMAGASRGFLTMYHGLGFMFQGIAPMLNEGFTSFLGDDAEDEKNYLKARIEDVILDPSGGMGSLSRTALQMAQGGSPFRDPKGIMVDYMVTNRMHPSVNVLYSTITGKDFFGESFAKKDLEVGPVTVSQELMNHILALGTLLPISYQQILEIVSDTIKEPEEFVPNLPTNLLTVTASFTGINAYKVDTDLQKAEAREIPNAIGVKEWEWPKPTYPEGITNWANIDQVRVVDGVEIPLPKGVRLTDAKVFKQGVQMNELKRRYKELYENMYAGMLVQFPSQEALAAVNNNVFPGSDSDVAKSARWDAILNGSEEFSIKGIKQFWESNNYPELLDNNFFNDPEVINLINAMPLNKDYVEEFKLREQMR